jgi:hypothetical protein
VLDIRSLHHFTRFGRKVLFIPDGLRALMVSKETAPTMAAIRDKGVNFKNPHSLFPTFTTPDASAMATGQTILNYQLVGTTRYFDAAGFLGGTVGLNTTTVAAKVARSSP